MIGNGRSHCLDGVVDGIQPGVGDGLAQRFKTGHVQGDVVINDENGAGSVLASVADIGKHAIEGKRVKVPAAHLDNRAEAAVKRASARSFDDVDLPSEHRIAAQYPRISFWRFNYV